MATAKKTAKKTVKKTNEIDASKLAYNKKFTESSKTIDKNVKKGLMEKSGVVSKNSKATVKPYEKKFIPATKERTSAMIVDSSGRKVKTATTNKGSDYGNKMLYREYQRDSTDTMNRRANNLNFVNVHTGNKKTPLTTEDIKGLKDTKKISKK
jgi:hypothetical protein